MSDINSKYVLYICLKCIIYYRIPLCSLINQHMQVLAAKYPTVKFLKSIATTCIPNFPEKNLPSIFIYFEGDMKRQLVGPHEVRGPNLTQDGVYTYILFYSIQLSMCW